MSTGRLAIGKLADVKTILLVDDEYSIVEVLGHLLEEEGYTVVTASNGQHALDRAAEAKPGLVITDLMMPLMSGADLIRALKKDPALRRVPVILISSAPLAGPRKLGWAELITKPFDFEELLQAVRHVFPQGGE